jgi:hypothetical protein
MEDDMKSFLEFVISVVLIVVLLPHGQVLAERLSLTETPVSTAPAGVEITWANASQYIVYCEGTAQGLGSAIRMGWDLVTNQCRPHDVYDEIILTSKALGLAFIDGLNKIASQ